MENRIVSFELTMPNKGSWNGKWTGDNEKYYIIKTLSEKFLNSKEYFKRLVDKGSDNFYYSFGDGWGANVVVEIIDGVESRKRRRISKGFWGYDWMVESILYHGRIEVDRKNLLVTSSEPR